MQVLNINAGGMGRLASVGLAVLCLGWGSAAWAARQEIAATCTTAPTGTEGVRYRCASEPVRIQAPPGHVFLPDSLQGGEVSASGSEHACTLSWEDAVTVDARTGARQPTAMVLKATARGPQEKLAGRGWVNCKYSVEVMRLP